MSQDHFSFSHAGASFNRLTSPGNLSCAFILGNLFALTDCLPQRFLVCAHGPAALFGLRSRCRPAAFAPRGRRTSAGSPLGSLSQNHGASLTVPAESQVPQSRSNVTLGETYSMARVREAAAKPSADPQRISAGAPNTT